MAKKGQQVQLLIEVGSDEEWEKLLDREGLIIVDVYSDWCGPCVAMGANLKKLKLDIGGDFMHLATAKSDTIRCLSRFKDKSEPTWLFVANRKMVNLMFGADSPRLTRLVAEELKKELAAREGARQRDEMEVTELAPEERVRYESTERDRLANEEIENEIKMKAKNERLNQIVDCILTAHPKNGVVMIFPYATDKHGVISDIWDAGIKSGYTERLAFKNTDLNDLLYFTDYRFPESVEDIIHESPCTCYMVRIDDEEVNFDDMLLTTIYGPSQTSPGSPDSIAQRLRTSVKKRTISTDGAPSAIDQSINISVNSKDDSSEGASTQAGGEEEEILDGIWVPPNSQTRALALYMCFHSQTASHVPPEPEPTPPHIAVAYDAFKRTEVMALIQESGKEVMRFGFFTDEKPEEAKLIAKTIPQFEKKAEETTFGEKMILQLSKKSSDTVLAFAQLGPTYMSPNSVEGEKDCKQFFPKGYDVPEVGEVEVQVKKKGKKKKKSTSAVAVTEEQKGKPEGEGDQKETFVEGEEAGEGIDAPELAEDEDGETIGEDEDGEDEDMPDELDKATSPMGDEGEEGEEQGAETDGQGEEPPTEQPATE